MTTLKEKAYIAAGDATEEDNQVFQQLINEAKNKDNPVVTIGVNGKLVKNSLFLSEFSSYKQQQHLPVVMDKQF